MWRVTPKLNSSINAWCIDWANSAGSAAEGGAGNSPDAAKCIVEQIGQLSSGTRLGICSWPETDDDLSAAACTPLETVAKARDANGSGAWTWPNDKKS
jgi:hypothetical protein